MAGSIPATNDGRGIYKGLTPYIPGAPKWGHTERGDMGIALEFLEANYYLAREFYPELDKESFTEYWQDEFQYYEGLGLKGQLQLNFPEIPCRDLIEKYRDLTRKLKGTGEDVEALRNYFPEYFTPELLGEADSHEHDWVTMIVENEEADANNDPTIFGMGLPYGSSEETGTMCYESNALIRQFSEKYPEIGFGTGTMRTRIIQSLLFMHARLSRKEKKFATNRAKIKFWAIQLILSERNSDGWTPYIFLDGGGGTAFGKDGGGGNSVYGFCIQALRKQ